MSILQKIADKLKPHPKDVNGIDFGASETRIVRIRKNGDVLTLTDLDTLPPVDFQQENMRAHSFTIPAKCRANYAAICFDSPRITLKLLSIPGAPDQNFDQKLAKNLGLPEDANDRVGYRIISEGSNRAESRMLAIGLPEPEASHCMKLFASGLPAPWSLEAAPTATLTAFEASALQSHKEAIALIDMNSRFSSFSIFFEKKLVLLRRFDLGMDKVYNKITTSLNVDHNTAVHILADGAFDVTDLLHDILQPLFSQLILSRDFIERRENCSISSLYLSGELAASSAALNLIHQTMNAKMTPWDPFEIPNLSISSALPPEYSKQHWRFGAALGAALAVFKEEQ